MSHSTIYVVPSNTANTEGAAEFCARYGYHCLPPDTNIESLGQQDPTSFLLTGYPDAPALIGFVDGKLTSLPLMFTQRSLSNRLTPHALKNSLLVKSMGKLPPAQTQIIDATCGLGTDTLTLAAAGFTVHSFERHPILALLLNRAFEENAELPSDVLKRITFHGEDFLKTTLSAPIVYCDPMFPKSNKTALPNRQMQLLRRLQSTNADDEVALFEKALSVASTRVVFKRPKHAPFLKGLKPNYQIQGRSLRFDVYAAEDLLQAQKER